MSILSINIGNISIGAGNPVAVQSMTNTDTRDPKITVAQINELADAGCDFVRVAVPDKIAADALADIVRLSPIPVVADVHFDYRLALAAIEAGVAKLRINPGNIGDNSNVEKIADAANEKNIPIRVGVNSGSLEKKLMVDFDNNKITLGQAMAESALNEIKILENCGFRNIVISVKASNVPETIDAYKILNEKCDYPLHVGITEAGTLINGIIKSAVGIGALLAQGIGDTIRVSLTAAPVEEVKAGRKILQALKLRPYGPEIISCPTCGRTQVDVIKIANELEERIEEDKKLSKINCTIAVMGCIVNGPGEAKHADIGFAGGKNEGVIFKKGEKIEKTSAGNAVSKIINEILKLEYR